MSPFLTVAFTSYLLLGNDIIFLKILYLSVFAVQVGLELILQKWIKNVFLSGTLVHTCVAHDRSVNPICASSPSFIAFLSFFFLKKISKHRTALKSQKEANLI